MAEEVKKIYPKRNEEKKALYKKLIDDLIKAKDGRGLLATVEHLARREGAEMYGRTYITSDCIVHLCAVMMDEATEPLELKDLIVFTTAAVDVLRPLGENFPDALMRMIRLQSEAYQGEGDFKKAAGCLTSFKFDTYRTCSASADDRVAWHVDTARFWVAVTEIGSASQAIKRAHVLVNDIKSNPDLVVRFKSQYARVLDNERKFFEASMRYKDLAQTSAGIMSEAEIREALECSVTTAILAPAGPSRARLLALLISDERSRDVQNFFLLEKMFKEQIVRPAEVERFEKTLQEHQNAAMAKGRTVLQHAISEHNMLAASKIYNNIRLDQLGSLLGISTAAAEALASTMIEQGRMSGTIDQVEGLVEFDDGGGTGSLATWDGQIQDACLMVNSILESVSKKHPTYRY